MGIAHQNGNGNVVASQAEGNANGNNGNQIRCYNCRGLGHLARNYTVRPRRRDAAYLLTQLLIAQKEETEIQLQDEEFDLMVAAADLDEIEETNKALVYDSDGSAEVQLHDHCYNNEIFNMFTLEEQYTELLEPIPEPHEVPPNDSNVISEVSSVEQGLDLTYDPLTITSQKPTERELDLLFEVMYDDYIGGQPSAAPRTALATSAPQVLQTPMKSTTTTDTAPTPTNSSSQVANIPNTS
ncbi:hypothetical protein Tco_0728998 [Tanacetum coccineum]|uniref:CCHC-type domain-containing protein n=1 Tax=Tanacetum coccineum TaxID=301880 RepID=A0ABQ4YQC5_9ASTR